MKTRIIPGLNTAFVVLALAGALLLSALNASAQTTPNPPDLMTYQGFLVDANGMALGINAPKNYDVIFRIWDASSAGNVLWTEQQTVVVDKGYFSVLLGEGSSIGEPRPGISTLFANSTASDRWVGITVKGIGPGGGNADILPRLRLLTSPYSFLARKAVNASTLVNDANVAIASASGSTLAVNGTLAATSLSGNLDGSSIATGTVPDSRLSPNIALRAGGNTFAGNQTVTSGAFVGDGTIPVGGIIMWSGSIANIPSGWALCDGQAVNGIGTPDLRDRFVVGAGGGYGVAGTGGSALVTLSAAQMPSHAHSFKDGFLSLYGQRGSYAGGGWDRTPPTIGPVETSITSGHEDMLWRPMVTDPNGGNQPFDNRPPWYALAYIMRVR